MIFHLLTACRHFVCMKVCVMVRCPPSVLKIVPVIILHCRFIEAKEAASPLLLLAVPKKGLVLSLYQIEPANKPAKYPPLF